MFDKYYPLRLTLPLIIERCFGVPENAAAEAAGSAQKTTEEISTDLLEAVRDHALNSDDNSPTNQFVIKSNALAKSEYFLELMMFNRLNPKGLPIKMRPAFATCAAKCFPEVQKLFVESPPDIGKEIWTLLFDAVYPIISETFHQHWMGLLTDINEVIYGLGFIPAIFKPLVAETSDLEQLMVARTQMTVDVLSSIQYMPADIINGGPRRLNWKDVLEDIVGKTGLLSGAGVVKSLAMADVTCEDEGCCGWSATWAAIMYDISNHTKPGGADVPAILTKVCGVRTLAPAQTSPLNNSQLGLALVPAGGGEAPSEHQNQIVVAAVAPKGQKADGAAVLPKPKTFMSINELEWFVDNDRSKKRERLLFSADSARLGHGPDDGDSVAEAIGLGDLGVPHIKQLSLAIHSHLNLLLSTSSSWADELVVNVAQGPAKKLGLYLDPTQISGIRRINLLAEAKLVLAGPVGTLANDKAWKTAEVFGISFYVIGSHNFTSDAFAPAWLIKVNDAKANMEFVEYETTMYHLTLLYNPTVTPPTNQPTSCQLLLCGCLCADCLPASDFTTGRSGKSKFSAGVYQ